MHVFEPVFQADHLRRLKKLAPSVYQDTVVRWKYDDVVSGVTSEIG